MYSLFALESDETFADFESGNPPILRNICGQAGGLANRLRQTLRARQQRTHLPIRAYALENVRRRGARWMNKVSNQLLPALDRFTPNELDQLVGCIARVEHAIGRSTAPFQRLKAAAERRIYGF